jgi:hypothetical protein
VAAILVLANVSGCSAHASLPVITVEERAFSFQVPADWYPVVFDPETKTYPPVKDHQAEKLQAGGSLFYMSKGGDFFYVEFDPGGHDASSDLEWTVEPRGDRFVLLKEGPFCTPPPPDLQGLETCSVGDNRLDILLEPLGLRLRDHQYFLKFGNVKREQGVDYKVFREVLASFRAK